MNRGDTDLQERQVRATSCESFLNRPVCAPPRNYDRQRMAVATRALTLQRPRVDKTL